MSRDRFLYGKKKKKKKKTWLPSATAPGAIFNCRPAVARHGLLGHMGEVSGAAAGARAMIAALVPSRSVARRETPHRLPRPPQSARALWSCSPSSLLTVPRRHRRRLRPRSLTSALPRFSLDFPQPPPIGRSHNCAARPRSLAVVGSGRLASSGNASPSGSSVYLPLPLAPPTQSVPLLFRGVGCSSPFRSIRPPKSWPSASAVPRSHFRSLRLPKAWSPALWSSAPIPPVHPKLSASTAKCGLPLPLLPSTQSVALRFRGAVWSSAFAPSPPFRPSLRPPLPGRHRGIPSFLGLGSGAPASASSPCARPLPFGATPLWVCVLQHRTITAGAFCLCPSIAPPAPPTLRGRRPDSLAAGPPPPAARHSHLLFRAICCLRGFAAHHGRLVARVLPGVLVRARGAAGAAPAGNRAWRFSVVLQRLLRGPPVRCASGGSMSLLVFQG